MKTLRTQLITTSAAALALAFTPFAWAQQSDRGSQSENPTATRAQSDTTGSQQQQQSASSATEQPSAASQQDSSTDTQQPQQSSTAQQDTSTSATSQLSDPTLQSSTESQTQSQIAASPSESSAAGRLQIADDDAKDRSDRKLAGRKVRGSDGKDLGSLKDLLVDPQSGEVAFGVVSSGGFAGIGDKNYLVPFKALQSGTDKDEFTVSLGKAEWEQLTPVNEDQFKEGRITMSDAERRQLAQNFERAQSGAAASGSSFYTSSISSYLVRASNLRGKDVHAGSEEIGTIEALVIDEDDGKALALFDAKKSFTDADAKFLVPLNRFTLGTTKRDRVTTSLTRVDFDQVKGGLHTDAADTAAAVTPSGADIATTRVQETFDTTTTDQTADVRAGTSTSPATTASTGTTSAGTTSRTTDEQLSATGRTTTDKSQSQTTDQSAGSSSSSATTQRERDQELAVSSAAAAADSTTVNDQELSATGRTSTDQSSSVASSTPRSSSASPTASQTPSRTGVTPPESGTTPSGRTMPDAARKDESQSTASTTDSARSQGIAGSSTTTTDQAQLGAGRTSSGQSASAAGVASVDQPSSTTETQSTTEDQTKSTSTVADTTPTTSTEPELSPTGQTSAEQSPAGADAALLSAAQAIRTMLDEDDTLARLDVRVTPENGKLVLRGKVKDESQKKSIEEKAEKAASGKQIDSKLTIER